MLGYSTQKATYCPNYTIYGVVSLYQTTALLLDCFLKAMQRKMPVTLGMGTTLLQNFHLLSISDFGLKVLALIAEELDQGLHIFLINAS